MPVLLDSPQKQSATHSLYLIMVDFFFLVHPTVRLFAVFFGVLRFFCFEDSDDDGSVHLGEVLASQTAARAPPGAPANAVPGWTGNG